MKQIIIVFIFISFGFGCKKEERICVSVTKELLQGNWSDEKKKKAEHNYYGVYLNDITFYGDSFKYENYVVADYTNCNGSISFTNYSIGVFIFRNDSIILTGNYCDNNYNINFIPICSSLDTGIFIKRYDFKSFCSDTLILRDSQKSMFYGMELIKN